MEVEVRKFSMLKTALNKIMHTCQFCPKSFSRPSHLTRHLRVHTGEKPFFCFVCGKGFKQSNHLTSHAKIHHKSTDNNNNNSSSSTNHSNSLTTSLLSVEPSLPNLNSSTSFLSGVLDKKYNNSATPVSIQSSVSFTNESLLTSSQLKKETDLSLNDAECVVVMDDYDDRQEEEVEEEDEDLIFSEPIATGLKRTAPNFVSQQLQLPNFKKDLSMSKPQLKRNPVSVELLTTSLKCELCTEEFMNYNSLRIHLETHTLSSSSSSPLMAIKSLPRRRNMNGFSFRDYLSQRTVSVSEDGQLQVQSKENLELEEHGTSQVWLKPDKDKDSVDSVSSREVVEISSSEEKIFHPVDTLSDSDGGGDGDDDDDVVIIKPDMDSEINIPSSKGTPQSAELDSVRLGQSSDIRVMSDGKQQQQQQALVLHSRDFNEDLSKPPTPPPPPPPPPFLKENNRSKSRLSPPNLRLLEKILSGENIDQSHLNTLSSTSSSSSLSSSSSSSSSSTSQLLSVKHQLFTRFDSNRNDRRDHHHPSPSRLSSRDKLTTRPSWLTANPSTISSNKRRYQNLSSEPSGTANTTTATTNTTTTSTDTAATITTKSTTDTPQMPDPITSNKINSANIPQNRTLFSSTIPENSSQTSFSRSSSKLVPHQSTSFNASSHTTSVQQQRRREGHRSLSVLSGNNNTNPNSNSNPMAKTPLTTNRQQITNNNNNNNSSGSGSSFLAFKNQHQIFQSRIKKPHLNTFGFGLYQNRNRFLSGISSQNRFRCKYCPKAFSRPSHLARHTRVHTGEKPFKCRYCSKQFRQSNHLTTHVRIHTDLKPFQQQQQQQHSNKNNKAQLSYRPYECQLCGHTFSLLEHLNEHLQSHVADFGCREQQGDNNNNSEDALLMPNPNQNSVVIDDEASSSQHSIVEESKPPPPSSLQDSLDISVSKSRSTEQSLLHPSVLYVNKLSEVSEGKDSKCVEVLSDNGSIIEITKNFDSSDEEDPREDNPNNTENDQVSAGNSFNGGFIDPCTNQVWSLQTEGLDSKTSLSVSVSSAKEFHEQMYIPESMEWKHEINSDSTDNQSVECGGGGDSVTDHISLSLSEIQSSLKTEAEPDEEFGTGSSARFTQNKVPSPSSPRGTEYQADGYVIKIKEEPLDEEEIGEEEDMTVEEQVSPQNGKSPSPGYKYATDNNAARKFLEKDANDDFHDNHVEDINFEDNASRQFLEKDAADDFYGNRVQNIKTEACDIVDLGNTYPLSIHEQNILKKVLQTSARVLKEDLQRFTELKLNMQHSAELEHRQNRADTDHRQNRDVDVTNYNVAPHTDYFDTQSGIKCDYCNKYFDNLNLFSIHIKSHFTDNQSFFQEDSPSSSLRFNQNFHSKQAPPPPSSSSSSSTTAQNTLMANVSSTEGGMCGIKPSSDKSSYPCDAAASPSWSKKKAAAMKENKAKPATTSGAAKKPMFSCSYCEKSFSRPSHLTRHIRIHTGEKPFKCDICDKSFTQSNHLTSHLKIHSERKLPDYITSLQAFSILTSQFEAQPSRKRAASWYTDPADRGSNSSYNQKHSSENSNGLETLNTTTTTSTTTASTAFTTMTTTTTTRTTSSNNSTSSSGGGVGVQREITAANHDSLLTPSKEIDKVSPNLSPDDPSRLSELPGVNHGTVDGLSELREEHSGLTSLYNSPDNNNHCTPEISSVINSEDHSTCLPPLTPVVLAKPTLPSTVPPNPALPSATPPNTALPSTVPPNPALPSATPPNTALPSGTPPNTALPSTVPHNSALPSGTPPNTAVPPNSALPSLMSPDEALHLVSTSNSTLPSVASSNTVPSSVLVANPSSPQNLPRVTQIKVEQNAGDADDDDAVPVTDYSSTQCYEEVKIAAVSDRHLLYPQNGVKTESLPNIGNIF